MPERRGDVQRFGPQAFETRSLRRLIDTGFHFTYGPTEFLCAHTDREFLYNGPTEGFQFATRITTCFALTGHNIRRRVKHAIEMDIGQWYILWSVLCYGCMTNCRNIFVCFENR